MSGRARRRPRIQGSRRMGRRRNSRRNALCASITTRTWRKRARRGRQGTNRAQSDTKQRTGSWTKKVPPSSVQAKKSAPLMLPEKRSVLTLMWRRIRRLFRSSLVRNSQALTKQKPRCFTQRKFAGGDFSNSYGHIHARFPATASVSLRPSRDIQSKPGADFSASQGTRHHIP